MLFWIAAFALSAQAQPPAAPAARGPRLIAGPLLDTDDYPRDARAARAEGRVSFHLEISPQGRVVGCAITGSSGFASIDAATCRLLRARARYRPARDAAGNAVAGTDNGSVVWRLPPDD